MMASEILHEKVKALKLYGLIKHWPEISNADWLESFLLWEEEARSDRSLERRLNNSRIERFKMLSEFDWNWPKKCDREAIEEMMQLGFLSEASNVILCGPNGAGKTTIAKNLAYQAVVHGHTALFVTAGKMLTELNAQEGAHAIRRRLKYYVQPELLIIDEVGYLSYSNRHADLLFEIVSQRYQKKSTVITTNKPFTEWNEIFPNASCVVSLVDRLIHRSEIISIDAESFRLKEAKEENLKRKASRDKGKITKSNKIPAALA